MATPTVPPSQDEIDDVLNGCAEADEVGGSAYPGKELRTGRRRGPAVAARRSGTSGPGLIGRL
jgi:hypothetical protein